MKTQIKIYSDSGLQNISAERGVMSSIIQALEKLDDAVGKLEHSVNYAEKRHAEETDNVVDVDFVSKRLDSAISAVEYLLDEGEQNHATSHADN